MSCWYNRMCTAEDVAAFYAGADTDTTTTTTSPYASGAMMGRADALATLLRAAMEGSLLPA